jgi:signal transduction histidine kinase
MNAMEVITEKTMMLPDRRPLLGIADEAVAKLLIREVERFAPAGRVVIASSLSQLRQLSSRIVPEVILLDYELLKGAPLAESLRQLTVTAPVIVLAPAERQVEVARLTAGGDVDFIARVGDFIPLAASLIERRLRWASLSGSMIRPPWAESPGDIATIFRHEINNPLTGILGNAEMLLAHREHLSSVDTQRLQTIVDLAVRLRETIRRLSNAWETPSSSVKSA